MKETNGNMKNKQIQGLRGVACLLIVIFHYFVRYQQIYHEDFTANPIISHFPFIGVASFFLISGFFFESSGGGINLLKKRFTNLWPRYFGAISFIFLITRFIDLPKRTVTIKAYLLNIPFINGFIGVDYVDAAHWFLTTLIACMVCYSIICIFPENKRVWGYIIWTSCILGCSFFVGYVSGITVKMLRGILICLGGEYSPIVVLGTMINRKKYDYKNYICICIGVFAILYNLGTIRVLELILCMAVVWLAGNQKIKLLENRALVFLGGISYSIYLLHQNIGFIILRSLEKSGYHFWMPFIAVFIAVIMGVGFDFIYIKVSMLVRQKYVVNG